MEKEALEILPKLAAACEKRKCANKLTICALTDIDAVDLAIAAELKRETFSANTIDSHQENGYE